MPACRRAADLDGIHREVHWDGIIVLDEHFEQESLFLAFLEDRLKASIEFSSLASMETNEILKHRPF